ncbi:MAG: hypothetical protein HC820_01020 [Hydrococcus sp. RM1_1_31]|nr:hypothetical protein [Hydrococcus sp. RM1_1_31]
MNSKEIDSRLAEIEIFKDYINSRIDHLENHKQAAQRKKDIELFKAQQAQCRTILEYLDDRKSILNHVKNSEVV